MGIYNGGIFGSGSASSGAATDGTYVETYNSELSAWPTRDTAWRSYIWIGPAGTPAPADMVAGLDFIVEVPA